MRRHIITSIFLALICGQMAQGKQAKPLSKSRGQNATAIKVYPARGKRIRIVAGAKRTLVTLTDDISGCLELFEPRSPNRIFKEPLVVNVIDRIRKDDKYYLVLLAEANSNCNVEGLCGRQGDHTLIWLKLGAGLKLEEKKAAVIDDCQARINVVALNGAKDAGSKVIYLPDRYSDVDAKMEGPIIKLASGKLTIEYGNMLDDDVRTLSQLVYDRKFPEQGFVITTTKK
jgi:hypothetical protein